MSYPPGRRSRRFARRVPTACWTLVLLALVSFPTASRAQTCARDISADVVALDQPLFLNRLGAMMPHGMVFALKRDVVAKTVGGTRGAGSVKLRDDKRPRPLTLRMNVGDCLTIHFTNWLNPTPVDDEQVATRDASVRVVGLQLVTSISDDGSHVGTNPNSLVAPGATATYKLYAEREGTHLLYNGGALVGGEGDNGTISAGLFGAVNVEPAGSVWYRSQLTRVEMNTAQNGFTAAGQPILDYDAVYPVGHAYAGLPILKMLDGNQIVHSDLTAIISGPASNDYVIPDPYPLVEVLPDRNKPFREFTIVFHDEIGAVQAFPHFKDPVLAHTLHSARDAFAINYGTGGIGAEILANRIGVGPMAECVDCLYEEFFLTSWAVGDPAMIVDVPANTGCSTTDLKNGTIGCVDPNHAPATKVFYPDDPSNVYHSYLNDNVKFRNLLAGSDDHHIFHLHAHQWLRSPDGDNSTYLDSQAIGQGTAFTYEIAHGGSGNRNLTVGDSIFHCHFYPHFAQGMWALWRVHDVYERGTVLQESGVVHPDAFRALPDGEIVNGTPIPGVVPLPGEPLAPFPGRVFLNQGQFVRTQGGPPGYPFFIPGRAGHRPPHPPLDFYDDGVNGPHDGGLPRHVFQDGGSATSTETRLNFDKEMITGNALELPETGTPWEIEAMAFHAQTDHPTCLPDGTCDTAVGGTGTVRFLTNGAPEINGAPYADPCLANPATTGTPPPVFYRTYKAANIQDNVVLNKEGWHFQQQRFLALWEDVTDYLFGNRPPEPFFFRANTYDCITYLHTNLVPKVYELDDFQVRTPTDILGQHIHLVKFDVTSSDGSANGWNYEDGTLSPQEVRHRIEAINAYVSPVNGEQGIGLFGGGSTGRRLLTATPHPFFDGKHPEALGAQTTVQRWYVDDVLNKFNEDRTLRTVFTHDHFGPSTHQQVGLYAGLVVEHQGADWYHNETGDPLGGQGFQVRHDGGPTTWQAVIEGNNEEETFREFLLEFGDFQHAYLRGSRTVADPDPNIGFSQPFRAINPPGRVQQWDDLLTTKPWVYEKPALVGRCPTLNGTTVLPPCPEAIAADDPGTKVVNYRQEPIALRIWDGNRTSKNQTLPGQAANQAGDMAYVFRSDVTRDVARFNTQPTDYDPLTSDLAGGDPYTPLLRAYEGDRVQVRILVGAHEAEHNFSIHGVRWLAEIAEPNSGYRNSQMMGISEHYEFEVPALPRTSIATRGSVDFLWKAGASVDDLWDGIWGLMRAYKSNAAQLRRLSTNPEGHTDGYVSTCPQSAPVREFHISAVAAWETYNGGTSYLPGQTLVYNSRTTNLQACEDNGGLSCQPTTKSGPLHDPTAMIFVEDQYWLSTHDAYQPGPLVLRAAAGDCLRVFLTNRIQTSYDLPGYSLMPNILDEFNINQVTPSLEVGLHPQLLAYDVTRDDGVNVGFNPKTTVSPGQSRMYEWYAGRWVKQADGSFTAEPVEFGAINLISADPIKHSNKGLVGAVVIEPENSQWISNNFRDPSEVGVWTDGRATIGDPDFWEHVTLFQTDVNLRYGDGSPARLLPVSEDPAETGHNAVNYKTEPVWFRLGILPETEATATRLIDMADVFANSQVGDDPETPVFTAYTQRPSRFRVLNPSGHSQENVFALHGHIWEEFPYINQSTELDADGNPYSQWVGSQFGHGPSNHFDVLLKDGPGGRFDVLGDYMWRDMVPWYLSSGVWGLLRVQSGAGP